MENRPRGREKNITGTGKPIEKQGNGLGTGPVGRPGGYSGRPTGNSSASSHSSSSGFQRPPRPQQTQQFRRSQPSAPPTRAGGRRKRGCLFPIILVILLVVVVGWLFSDDDDYDSDGGDYSGLVIDSGHDSYGGSSGSGYSGDSSSSSGGLSSLNVSDLFSSLNAGSTSTGWSHTANIGKLDTSVAPEARAKRTDILGGGRDTVTIMVYLCGTDLESKSGMASADLSEMAKASISDNVNIIVYTGGCKRWKTKDISSSTNQIYQVVSGGLRRLDDDAGDCDMTKPATLTDFIRWCSKNYPANRNELILWDHGGGSLTGYAYDEKYPYSSAMDLEGIHNALRNAGVTFDFIGFDACLMATTETALMLTPYADYLIASEESEPGIGWYYTNWLNKLSANTSMPTIEIGRYIVDDFVDTCARECGGQEATLSVIDLAELEKTVPPALRSFSSATSDLLSRDGYQTVSNARIHAREFASFSKLDQVDLVDMALNMNTPEGNSLAKALLGAVKYNRSNMTDAYGLSIFFPYKKPNKVKTAAAAYEAIDLDAAYTNCIRKFASLTSSGQYVSGGDSSPAGSLNGSGYSSEGDSYFGFSDIFDALYDLLDDRQSGGSEAGAFLDPSLDRNVTAAYLSEHQFDPSALKWSTSRDGTTVMTLSAAQWDLITGLELNVFYDDGEGYIDLGLDNVFDFTDSGDLLGAYDGTWLAINNQPVPYYHESTFDNGENYRISGFVPVLLNGDPAQLILVFDNEHPQGYVAGARYEYDGETETVAKALTSPEAGDTLRFVCDYYRYDGTYVDSYILGDLMQYSDDLSISNVYIDASRANATYLFTDIYQQEYWSPVIP